MLVPAHAFELPVAISPSLAGIVGALAGVCAFLAVVAVAMRKKPARSANDSLSIPPYATFDRTLLTTPPSSRGYARMGFAFGERVEEDPIDPLEMLAPMVPGPSDTEIFPKVKVAPVVVLSGPPAPANREPNPLGIIKGSALALKKPLDETLISEPAFDVVPQPQRMGSRPKIRPIAPSAPRFPSAVA